MDLAERHLVLARKLAWRAAIRYRQRDFDAVESDALLGLALAAKRCESEATFEGFARRYITGSILHGIRDRSGVRRFRERGEQEPTQVSLDALGGTGALTAGPAQDAERSDLWRQVDMLPEDERLAVRSYYQFGFSQDEIAASRGVNQMAVSRSLARARKRLRVRLADF